MVPIRPDCVFIDRMLWNLNTPRALADVYMSRVAMDLDLSVREGAYIASEIKKKLKSMQAAVVEGKASLVEPKGEGASVLRKERTMLPNLLTGAKAREFLERRKSSAKRSTPEPGGGDGRTTPDPAPPGADGDKGEPPAAAAAVKEEEDGPEGNAQKRRRV